MHAYSISNSRLCLIILQKISSKEIIYFTRINNPTIQFIYTIVYVHASKHEHFYSPLPPLPAAYLIIPSKENATRLFCPPDRLSIERKASSPETPNDPNCLRYSSLGFPVNKTKYLGQTYGRANFRDTESMIGNIFLRILHLGTQIGEAQWSFDSLLVDPHGAD